MMAMCSSKEGGTSLIWGVTQKTCSRVSRIISGAEFTSIEKGRNEETR